MRADTAKGPRLAAYPEGVRFDLDDRRFLPAGRSDGPQESEAYLLPTPLRMRAVRDEVVAFYVLASGAPGAHPVSVELKSATSSVGPVAETFVAHGIRIDAPTTSDFVHSLGKGLYPGPLEPTSTATVPAQGVAMIWVDVHVPLGTPAATYSGALHVGPSSLPLEIEVLDVDMPRRDAARLGTVNFGSLLMRGHEDIRIERSWMQMAHAHGLSVEILRPHPKVSEDGDIDWEGWASRIGPYIDGSAFTAAEGYHGPRAGVPTTRWVMPSTDWWPVEAKDRLPSDPARWSAGLKAWETFVESKGWFDLPEATTWILFVNSLDEPHDPETVETLAKYAPLIEAAGLSDRSRVLFRVDGNFGQKIEGYDDARMAEVLDPVTDLWNVHGAPWTIPWARLVKLRRESHDRVMVYFSNTSGEPALPPTVIDAPLVGLRAWGWIVKRYDLEGILNWEIDYWSDECPGNPRCSPGGQMNLEANLIFRAEAYGGPHGAPWPSIRLKALRRGAQDAALLSLLQQSAPDTAGLIAAAVVPNALGDQVPGTGPGAWSMDPWTYERARDAILDRLVGAAEPFPLHTIRKDPLPGWAWHPERWLMAIAIAIVSAAALVYIIRK